MCILVEYENVAARLVIAGEGGHLGFNGRKGAAEKREAVMKRAKSIRMVGAVALFAAVACKGEGVGISFQAVSGEGEVVAPGSSISDEGQTAFAFSELQVHLRDIELDLPDGKGCDEVADQLSEGVSCDDSSDDAAGDDSSNGTVRIAGPFVIDLLNGTSTPDLAAITVPAGTYKRIDFRIDDGDPDQGVVAPGSALDDRSLAGALSFDLDGVATTLRLSLRFNEDIRLEDPAGLTVDGNGAALLARFDANAWLTGLDISGCLDRGELAVDNGEVLVDDDAPSGSGDCSDIENTIKTNIKESGQLAQE